MRQDKGGVYSHISRFVASPALLAKKGGRQDSSQTRQHNSPFEIQINERLLATTRPKNLLIRKG